MRPSPAQFPCRVVERRPHAVACWAASTVEAGQRRPWRGRRLRGAYILAAMSLHITNRPVQPLPAEARAKPGQFPPHYDILAKREFFPHRVREVKDRWASETFTAFAGPSKDDSIGLKFAFLHEDPDGISNVASTPSNLHTRRLMTYGEAYGGKPEKVSFAQALASASEISKQDSPVVGEAMGMVGLLQARNGAYYVAWGWTHDENNPRNLADGDVGATASPYVKAIVDGDRWIDLR